MLEKYWTIDGNSIVKFKIENSSIEMSKHWKKKIGRKKWAWSVLLSSFNPIIQNTYIICFHFKIVIHEDVYWGNKGATTIICWRNAVYVYGCLGYIHWCITTRVGHTHIDIYMKTKWNKYVIILNSFSLKKVLATKYVLHVDKYFNSLKLYKYKPKFTLNLNLKIENW